MVVFLRDFGGNFAVPRDRNMGRPDWLDKLDNA